MTRLIFMLKDLIWIMEINSVPCLPGGEKNRYVVPSPPTQQARLTL